MKYIRPWITCIYFYCRIFIQPIGCTVFRRAHGASRNGPSPQKMSCEGKTRVLEYRYLLNVILSASDGMARVENTEERLFGSVWDPDSESGSGSRGLKKDLKCYIITTLFTFYNIISFNWLLLMRKSYNYEIFFILFSDTVVVSNSLDPVPGSMSSDSKHCCWMNNSSCCDRYLRPTMWRLSPRPGQSTCQRTIRSRPR